MHTDLLGSSHCRKLSRVLPDWFWQSLIVMEGKTGFDRTEFPVDQVLIQMEPCRLIARD